MTTELEKEKAIAELLEIDLRCPHCNEILEKANEREKRKRDSK